MTPAERNIADRLASINVPSRRHKWFIDQLKSWHDREMTYEGASLMLKLLNIYRSQIPDHTQLRSAYTNEQLQNLAP